MEKYYIEMRIDESRNASSKAVGDCNQILNGNGFKPFVLNMKKNGNKYIKKFHNGMQLYKMMRIPKGSMVVIPHPLYINKKYIDIFKKAKLKNNLKLVFLIHDLDSLRKMFKDALEDFKYMDNTMYEIADFIISHNQCMTDYIVSKGVDVDKVFNLGIFDYLTKPVKQAPSYANVINIAGNLDTAKCRYLSEISGVDKSVGFKLFGVNFNPERLNSDSIKYMGSFPADEIPNQLTEGWGLVWDGDSINGCTGSTGEYLRYNNPHKLSLYLASGMPVIVCKDAAQASYVENNNLGVTVSSINDIKDVFDNMTEEDYREKVANAMEVSEKLHSGAFLTETINNILKSVRG